MTSQEKLLKKLPEPAELEHLLSYWRFRDLKIVFTNGCFDIIHLGHIDYLSKASDLGDILIVGLNTDASTRRLKGPSRPVNDEKARSMVLASMSFIHAIVLFDEDTPVNLIKTVQPDFLVKGADYKPEEIAGYDVVTAKGGKVVTIDYLPGYSTSLIEKRIKAF